MKKTIIALLALAGVAAAETTKDLESNIMPTAVPTWRDKGTDSRWTNVTWDPYFKGDASNEATKLTTTFDILDINQVGHYAFAENGTATEAAITLTDGTLTIPEKTPTTGALFYVNVMSVSSLLQGYDVSDLNSVTFTLNGNTGTSNDTWFSVYKMNTSGTLTTIVELAKDNNATTSLKNWNGEKEYTYEVPENGLTTSDKLVFMIRHSASDDENDITVTLTGMTATANVTIPEPATATLSLLALAGLAARRRRK